MSQGADANLPQQEQYVYDYEDALTLKLHASRSAANQAAFFLPFLQPGMTLLDCGSGSGSITIGLAQVVAPAEVTGVEISEVEVARARDKAAAEGIANLHFEVGSVYNLPFPAESFDALFSHNVLEHLREPMQALREFHRVLKSGGVIGIRDADMRGSIFSAASEVAPQYLPLHNALWEKAGGNPHLGQQLRGLLHEAGFVDLLTTASYEAYGDRERLRFLSNLIVNRCEEPDFVRQVIELGLADQEKIDAIKAEWQALPDDPTAFTAAAHCEVVATKRHK